MPSSGAPDRLTWFGPALAIVLAVTVLRVWLLAVTPLELFVDEAQYWLWGQDPALGYASKPPLIAWLIGAVTALAQSDDPFWVRLPAPLLHGTTAILLGAVAARLVGGVAALWTVVAYLTLPLIAVGSLLISTDTVMFPFLAAGLLLWTSAVPEDRPGLGALAGALVGIGFLAKYAAIYFVGGALLAAALVPWARPSWRLALAGLAAFLAAVAPNVLWNVGNGLVTMQHTVDNIDWARAPAARLGFEWDELGEFTAAQFIAFGPVFLPMLVGLGFRWRRLGPGLRQLVLFSLPILLVVCVQALLSGAYANWAATAYLAGTVAVVMALWPLARGWLVAGVAFNALVSLAVATVAAVPHRLPDGLREVAADRYLGRVALSREIVALAEAQGLDVVVSDNRDVLADLFYTGWGLHLDFRAAPPDGPALTHYARTYPYEGGVEPVLFVGRRAPACLQGAEPIAAFSPAGYWEDRGQRAYVVPGDCWAAD
ncbi:ArnT family glycosyltransferase [Roseitranquillus sediminis]|uniref:ArnT family glycosyltransferase n=1 Tax=Roseitranquillus sediminis TaxID=2809051 RepID=UPI001D0C06D0|nr:glycosyltransferase family 39 protein [Roseitranquillus sediminis]MBM9593508.1 glycosyltransferase family 39 protein [Roseitranquillus sediminis]